VVRSEAVLLSPHVDVEPSTIRRASAIVLFARLSGAAGPYLPSTRHTARLTATSSPRYRSAVDFVPFLFRAYFSLWGVEDLACLGPTAEELQ